MGLKPKFTEQIIRIKTNRWTLRFWTKDTFTSPALKVALITAKEGADYFTATADPLTVAEAIENLAGLDEVAALEVLSNATQCGVVRYYDWP